MYFHHTIDYPDGRHFAGKIDHRGEPALLGLDVRGKTVLDLATNDGFFAFWAEQNGAAAVTALDVAGYADYDWGPRGAPAGIEALAQQDKGEVFGFHHANLGSKVEKFDDTIYSVDEFWERDQVVRWGDKPRKQCWDVIINYGLLYHLRHPVLALEKCRKACAGALYLETEVLTKAPRNVPLSLWPAGVGKAHLMSTDFNVPTEACAAAWLRLAGFDRIFIQKAETQARPHRQRFIACVSDEFTERARANRNFFEADAAYWDEIGARL